MGKAENIQTGQRLKQARKDAGMTVEDVAEATGQSVETVRSHEKGARGVRPPVLSKYAKLYSVTVAFLTTGRRPISGSGVMGINSHGMAVVGTAQADVFRETMMSTEIERIPVQYDITYAGSVQFALRVEGRSMDMLYPPGSYVICVVVEDSAPRLGDHVIARRQRGGLFEFSLKELATDPKTGAPILLPKSTDPHHQTPMAIGEAGAEIVAVVIGAYLRRPRRGPAAFSG